MRAENRRNRAGCLFGTTNINDSFGAHIIPANRRKQEPYQDEMNIKREKMILKLRTYGFIWKLNCRSKFNLMSPTKALRVVTYKGFAYITKGI